MTFRLIKESFQSNNLNNFFGQLSKSEKGLMIEDLSKISKKYDMDISSFNDTQVEMVEDLSSIDSEKSLIFNMDIKKWSFPTKGTPFFDDPDKYEKTRELTIEEFKELPNGTVVIADLKQDDRGGSPKYWAGVKYRCRIDGRSFVIQNTREGSQADSLRDTRFRYSWVIANIYCVGAGGIWLAKPTDDYKSSKMFLTSKLGELKIDQITVTNTEDSVKNEEDLYLTNYLKGSGDSVERKGDKYLVFHLDKMESTGLSSKVSQRGQYDKTTDAEKAAANLVRYTNQIFDKNKDDPSFVKKYLLGRELKMFYIVMFQRKALNLDFNESTKIIDFKVEYRKILDKIEYLKKNHGKAHRMDKIMEINRIVSDKINTFDLEDNVDVIAYRYYIKMVYDICGVLISSDSEEKTFESYYKKAKNVLR